MSDLFKFLQNEFLQIRVKLDSMREDLNKCVAHNRSMREVQATLKSELAALNKKLEQLQSAPGRRIFPLSSKEDVENLCRKFADTVQAVEIKKELGYVTTNINKDDWLRSVISDGAVYEFRTAEELKKLNFIKYVIASITHTADKTFTGMVNQAKARVYAHRYRLTKKNRLAGAEPPAKKLRKESEARNAGSSETEASSEEEEGNRGEPPSPEFSPLKKACIS